MNMTLQNNSKGETVVVAELAEGMPMEMTLPQVEHSIERVESWRFMFPSEAQYLEVIGFYRSAQKLFSS